MTRASVRWFYMLHESLLSAYRTVILNKLRTILSLMGITIGIFAIISVFTVLDSMENNIRESVSALGSDVIYVEKWPWMPEEGQEYKWWEYLNRPVASMRDYQQLKKRMDHARAVAFFGATQSTVEFINASMENLTVWGASEEFEETRDFDIARGRFLTPFEINSGKNFAVIGYSIMEELFRNIDPVGRTIKVKGKYLRIVGVFEKEGSSFVGGGSMDKVVLVPIKFLATVIDLRDDRSNTMIWIRAEEGIPVDQFKEEVRGTMRAIRRLKPSARDNFALNQSSVLNAGIEIIFGIINFAGGFIGILAVIVGAFGIANIMFVSVKERTNIIGIQKALGAKKYYIILEVLYESVLLSIIGGAIGLLLVYAGTLIVRNLYDFNIYLTPGNIMMGIVISTIVGIVAGLFPAVVASRLDPVKAIASTF
ncbi:MAG: ABC transporter permease [Bacteroidales bacterium]|nr:ABC transporter permease [Bacteroidales bacterium]